MRENIDGDGNDVDQKPKRGRPAAPEKERRSENLTLRVRSDVKEALEAHAIKNGRSVSAEAEAWLGQALLSEGVLDQALDLAFGRQVGGLTLLIGNILRDVGSSAGFQSTQTLDGSKNWLSDPYAFDQAAKALTQLFEQLRPDGEIVIPMRGGLATGLDLSALSENLGMGFLRTFLGAIAGEELSLELKALGAAVRERLAPEILERIKLNISAPQTGNG